MGSITGKDAAESLAEAAAKMCRELLIKRMKNERDQRGMEFVLAMLETSCAIIIEAVAERRVISKRVLIAELTKRVTASAKLINANNVNMVACIVNVTELAILTTESSRSTVLAAEVTSSAVMITAAVPALSAVVGIGGAMLTTATICAAAYELVQAFLTTLDSCKAALAHNPGAWAIVASYNPIEGSMRPRMTVA